MSNPVESESVGFAMVSGEEVEGEASTRLRKFQKVKPRILGVRRITSTMFPPNSVGHVQDIAVKLF